MGACCTHDEQQQSQKNLKQLEINQTQDKTNESENINSHHLTEKNTNIVISTTSSVVHDNDDDYAVTEQDVSKPPWEKNDVPLLETSGYQFNNIPFAYYACDFAFLDGKNKNNSDHIPLIQNPKLFLVGGSGKGETLFHELIYDSSCKFDNINESGINSDNEKKTNKENQQDNQDTQSIDNNDNNNNDGQRYGNPFRFRCYSPNAKQHACMDWCDQSMQDGVKGFQCFITRNNEKILAFHKRYGYNVYDAKKDQWLVKNFFLFNVDVASQSSGHRCLLINDEILIFSCHNLLKFYSIRGDYITKPQFIGKYIMQSQNYDYVLHGMCLTDCQRDYDYGNYNYNDTGKEHYIPPGSSITFKLTTFGGFKNSLTKIIEYKIRIACVENQDRYQFPIKLMIEHPIPTDSIKFVNFDEDHDINDKYYNFGCECVLNKNNEPVILIIAGNIHGWKRKYKNQSSVIVYHVNKNIMIKKENVLPFSCQDRPGTALVSDTNHYDTCVVTHGTNVGFFRIYDELPWKIERLLWIGFYKNDDNDDCFVSRLPKVLIVKILELFQYSLIND